MLLLLPCGVCPKRTVAAMAGEVSTSRARPSRSFRNAFADNVTNRVVARLLCFFAIPSALSCARASSVSAAGPDARADRRRPLAQRRPRRCDLAHRRQSDAADGEPGNGIALVAVGLVLALSSLTGAAQTVMWALNVAHRRDESRGFVRRRLIALAMSLRWSWLRADRRPPRSARTCRSRFDTPSATIRSSPRFGRRRSGPCSRLACWLILGGAVLGPRQACRDFASFRSAHR